MTVSGPLCFKQVRLNPDNTLKGTALATVTNDQEIVDHTWLMNDWVIAISESGRVWTFERVSGG